MEERMLKIKSCWFRDHFDLVIFDNKEDVAKAKEELSKQTFEEDYEIIKYLLQHYECNVYCSDKMQEFEF